MKKVALAVALSAAASTAFAGGLDEPIVEPEIIVEDTSTAGGILVPLLLLVLVGVAVSQTN
ncbi:MAG: hypothetical protein AAGB05_07360 [Pseudomonadota bacterium]